MPSSMRDSYFSAWPSPTPQPINYVFKKAKKSDLVGKALLSVAKFSRKQAMVKLSDSSVSIIWGCNHKTYFINVRVTAWDMFKNRQQLRLHGIDHCTVIQVNPSILGKTLKGGTPDRNVSLCIIKPNKMKVNVEYIDSAKRTMVHTLPCEIKTLDDYKSMLIEEIEQSVCRYDTRSYVDNIHRLRNIVDSFVKLHTPRIHIWSKQTEQGNNMIVHTRTQGSQVQVSLTDLENGFANLSEEERNKRRSEAGVNIDTKKLAFFLSSLKAHKRSKVSFNIEHNKCLRITLDNEDASDGRFYRSLLLLHDLNS